MEAGYYQGVGQQHLTGQCFILWDIKQIGNIVKYSSVKTTEFWINLFLRKGEISGYCGPRLLLLGETADFTKSCQVSFGA